MHIETIIAIIILSVIIIAAIIILSFTFIVVISKKHREKYVSSQEKQLSDKNDRIKIILNLFIIILMAVIVTIFVSTIDIFLFRTHPVILAVIWTLYQLPLILWLSVIGIFGLIIIPLGFYKLIKRSTVNIWLIRFISISIGFYIGFIIQREIHDWNFNQRNLSGVIITTEIENYKIAHSQYPKKLDQLGIDVINKKLPWLYQINRFKYDRDTKKYSLCIEDILDCWRWDKEKREFVLGS